MVTRVPQHSDPGQTRPRSTDRRSRSRSAQPSAERRRPAGCATDEALLPNAQPTPNFGAQLARQPHTGREATELPTTADLRTQALHPEPALPTPAEDGQLDHHLDASEQLSRCTGKNSTEFDITPAPFSPRPGFPPRAVR